MQNTPQDWLSQHGYGAILGSTGLAGGSINQSSRLQLSDGQSVFLKTYTPAPRGFFAAEVAGLAALRAATSLRVPEVLHYGDDFLLLEDLGEATPRADFWAELATGLGELHNEQSPVFGFEQDNFCGLTPQINTPFKDGFKFFAELRIRQLAYRAYSEGLLESMDVRALDYIADNLRRWIPEQAAVLIHGDLWSGNVHCANTGQPALIDPAAYWGWAEAELAMTLLFGGFDRRFYLTYEEATLIDSHWRERADLYNLYHLLNHLLLFGSSYAPQIRDICLRFAA